MSDTSEVVKASVGIVNSQNFGVFVIAVALLVNMAMHYQILDGIKTELSKQTEILRVVVTDKKF